MPRCRRCPEGACKYRDRREKTSCVSPLKIFKKKKMCEISDVILSSPNIIKHTLSHDCSLKPLTIDFSSNPCTANFGLKECLSFRSPRNNRSGANTSLCGLSCSHFHPWNPAETVLASLALSRHSPPCQCQVVSCRLHVSTRFPNRSRLIHVGFALMCSVLLCRTSRRVNAPTSAALMDATHLSSSCESGIRTKHWIQRK